MSMRIRHGERFGPRGPECRGSYQRVKLRTRDQIFREYECSSCGRVLRVRVSERTGEATLPRHRAERQAPAMKVGAAIHAPECRKCGSDLWVLGEGELVCYGTSNGRECDETRSLQ